MKEQTTQKQLSSVDKESANNSQANYTENTMSA